MTCAKKHISCVIVTRGGHVYHGTNACERPQAACPREPGEGYRKCITLCRQPGHAEIMALAKAKDAGEDLQGATATVTGAYHVCRDCARALRDAGIDIITIFVEKENSYGKTTSSRHIPDDRQQNTHREI